MHNILRCVPIQHVEKSLLRDLSSAMQEHGCWGPAVGLHVIQHKGTGISIGRCTQSQLRIRDDRECWGDMAACRIASIW